MNDRPSLSIACNAMLGACLPVKPKDRPPAAGGKLLSPKELADALGRNRTYVFAMKRRGFAMPGGRATLADALAWLEANPYPRRNTTEHQRN